jgi:hypothetical protein
MNSDVQTIIDWWNEYGSNWKNLEKRDVEVLFEELLKKTRHLNLNDQVKVHEYVGGIKEPPEEAKKPGCIYTVKGEWF